MNITNIQTFSEFSELAQEAAVKRFPDGCVDFFSSFVDFTIDCSKIKICQLLAKGNEGSVYSGLLENENYAIKVEELHSGVQEQANLIVELTILQSLPHDRLVRFMGAGLSNTPVGSKVMILTELCSHGSLRDALKLDLPWNVKVRLVLDLALGIQFLHDEHIIHRDIKTPNILVDGQWRGKLCDFSYACHEECSTKRDYIYGTDEFMSPEISLALDFDKAVDIFSFGIVLCEVITDKAPSNTEPYFLHRKAKDLFSLDMEELKECVLNGCPEGLEALVCLCCDVESEMRPTIQTCIEELEVVLNELGGPDFDYSVLLRNAEENKNKNATIVITTATNGTVNCYNNNSRRNGSNSNVIGENDNRTIDSSVDIIAQFNYLNIQIQELKNENKLMSDEMKNNALVSKEKNEQIEKEIKEMKKENDENSSNNSIKNKTSEQSANEKVDTNILINSNNSIDTDINKNDKCIPSAVKAISNRKKLKSHKSLTTLDSRPSGSGLVGNDKEYKSNSKDSDKEGVHVSKDGNNTSGNNFGKEEIKAKTDKNMSTINPSNAKIHSASTLLLLAKLNDIQLQVDEIKKQVINNGSSVYSNDDNNINNKKKRDDTDNIDNYDATDETLYHTPTGLHVKPFPFSSSSISASLMPVCDTPHSIVLLRPPTSSSGGSRSVYSNNGISNGNGVYSKGIIKNSSGINSRGNSRSNSGYHSSIARSNNAAGKSDTINISNNSSSNTSSNNSNSSSINNTSSSSKNKSNIPQENFKKKEKEPEDFIAKNIATSGQGSATKKEKEKVQSIDRVVYPQESRALDIATARLHQAAIGDRSHDYLSDDDNSFRFGRRKNNYVSDDDKGFGGIGQLKYCDDPHPDPHEMYDNYERERNVSSHDVSYNLSETVGRYLNIVDKNHKEAKTGTQSK